MHNLAKSLLLFPAAALLAACATQQYEAKALDQARLVADWQTRSLSDHGLRTYVSQAQGGESWGLRELTLAAWYFHPELQLSRAQWQAAKSAEITAGQRQEPGISTNAEHHSQADGISPWTWALGISIPVETGNKRAIKQQQSHALSEAARLDAAMSAWQIRSRLRNALLTLYTSQQQLALLNKEITLRQAVVKMLEARLTSGYGASTEVAEARLQLQKARTQLQTESSRSTTAKSMVAQAVGIPEQALANVQPEFSVFASLPPELPSADVQRTALLNRIELRRALARYAASEAKLQLEIARQTPDIVLSPGYSWDQGDNRWSLGLSLVLALLNKNVGPIAEAQAQREVEAQQFNTLQTAILGEQEQAWARYTAARQEIIQVQSLQAEQKQRLEQTQHQFDMGYADRLELAYAQLEALTVETALLSASLRAQQALGQLEDSVQQPLDGTAPLPDALLETPK